MIQRQQFADARLAADAAFNELRVSGQSGELRAAVVEANVTYTLHQFDGLSFLEASRVFERLQATLSKAGPSVPRYMTATVDHQYAGARLLWGDIQGADDMLTQSASVLSQEVEGTQMEGSVVASLGHAAMFSGRHDQADTLLRRRLAAQEFVKTAGSGIVVISYLYIAMNLHMSGRSAEALAVLDAAPKLQPYLANSVVTDELAVAKSRILSEMGHVGAALQSLPAPSGDVVDDNSVYLFAFSDRTQVRGEVLCAAGETQLGLGTIQRAIELFLARKQYEHDPTLARARALAGICAFHAGQRRLAMEMLSLAQRSFLAQPAVSSYFKAPADELERMLNGGSGRRRLLGA